MKNGNLMSMYQSGIWPILCQSMAISGKLVDMDFKFVLPCSYIIFEIRTNFEVNQTQICHSIPKNTKMAISQNPILPKCQLPKSLLLLHLRLKIFFGGYNQKSATISMCKIHIYIDSETFRQIN